MTYAAQFNRIGCAYVQSRLVRLAVVTSAHDVRNEDEHGLGFRVLLGSLPEEIFQDRNLGKSGYAGQRPGLRLFQHAAEQVGFPFLQADFVLDLALSDHGLADAADIGSSGHRRNIHRDLQRHFAFAVHLGGDFDFPAQFKILELRIHQRVDADAADARLEGSSRHRYAVANLQRSLLPIHGANLWLLNKLGAAVGEQGSGRSLRNGDGEVSRVEIVNLVEVELVWRTAGLIETSGIAEAETGIRRGGRVAACDVVLQGHGRTS